MLTLLAFFAALGLLVTAHEYGHYRAAVACDVKVLRFSVGFGRVLLRWKPRRQRPGQDTEFTLCALPLGGYVRMLDEREGPVDPALADRAFNRAPLRARFFIVAAGPLANLALAVLLYAAAAWMGQEVPRALLSAPVAGSLAERAGLVGGEEVLAVAEAEGSREPGAAPSAAPEQEALEAVASFDDLRWRLLQAALEGHDLWLQVTRPVRPAGPADGAASSEAPDRFASSDSSGSSAPSGSRTLLLPLSQLGPADADPALARRIGLLGPLTQPLLGRLVPGGAAERAGLQPGDRVLSAGGQAIVDGSQLRDWVRQQVGTGGQAPAATWRIERGGRELSLEVRPDVAVEQGASIGRIGAVVGSAPQWVWVRQGPWQGLVAGASRTWEVSMLTLRMMGRMVVGQASLSNLSGPLTIADYAGRSASQGLSQYLVFLAMVSVSLGVLNLLPLPVLDGGHLMYYLWEAVTGRGVSEAWMERLQRAGVAILLAMMSIALFNDLTRLLNNP